MRQPVRPAHDAAGGKNNGWAAGEEAKQPKKRRGEGRAFGPNSEKKNKFLSPFLFPIFQIHFQMIFEIIFFLK
jgi:hypothetical protein